MKKLLVMFLALALLSVGCLSLAQPAALAEDGEGVDNPIPPIDIPTLEEPLLPAEARVPGDWYALHQGAVLLLSVKEDGSYSLCFPGAELEPVEGTWTVKDNQLFLGEAGEGLLVLDGSLLWASAGMVFTREAPESYVPAEEFYDLEPGGVDGLWKCRYVGVGGLTVYAEALSDDTVMYIEGGNVALGGSFFGNVPLVFAYEEGAMTTTLGEGDTAVSLTLRLQQDGVLRLTVETGKAVPVIFYLSPQTPANAELPEG